MQLTRQSSDFVVTEPAQAAAFHNELRSCILIACARRENSLSQLQSEVGAPLPKLHYHVARLIEAGLLSVSRCEPRAGRPIRYYRAVAERFWVPHAMLPSLPSDEWVAELQQALRDEQIRAGELSLLYFPDEAGRMMVRLVRPDGSAPPRSMDIWRRLRLDPRQRAQFAKDLVELLDRYVRAEPGMGAETYLTHIAFAPRS